MLSFANTTHTVVQISQFKLCHGELPIDRVFCIPKLSSPPPLRRQVAGYRHPSQQGSRMTQPPSTADLYAARSNEAQINISLNKVIADLQKKTTVSTHHSHMQNTVFVYLLYISDNFL